MKNLFQNPFVTNKSKKIKVINLRRHQFMINKLDTNVFLNGDIIHEAKTDEEWGKAGIDCQPACCYFKNSNFKKQGKLYNWYAVNDSRGICPEGFHVPTSDEWLALKKSDHFFHTHFICKIIQFIFAIFKLKPRCSIYPLGYRSPNGIFSVEGEITAFWSQTRYDKKNSYSCFLYHKEKEITFVPYANNAGLSIICLKDV